MLFHEDDIFFLLPLLWALQGCLPSLAASSAVHIPSTQLPMTSCQTRDLPAVLFPLQHHIAIPCSGVSKELHNFNTNVLRVAVHLKEQCWAGFGRFAGSKLGWVQISA